MDAVAFLIEQHRMCEYLGDCNVCELEKENCCYVCNTKEKAEKAVEIVERWSKEHQKKTRKSEFLKVYPNAPVNPADGSLTIDPCALDWSLQKELCFKEGCAECRRKYWTEEVK